MATDVNTLLEASKCYENCAAPGQWQLLKLGLLQQILLASNPMADTSVNALLEDAKCYACLSPGIWMLLELALLQQIVNNGGGGSGGSTLCGAGAPVAAPSGTCALYINTVDGTLYEFYNGSWH
jgi:hypothetical protein